MSLRVWSAYMLMFLSACATTTSQRAALVAQIASGVSDSPGFAASASFKRTLKSMRSVKREDFVPRALRREAYAERSLAIGYGQTISDPYIVALMSAAADVQPAGRVLEVGTGSGYQAAVLSGLARDVYSIEIVEPLAKEAAARLMNLGYRNVRVRAGDGYAGWTEAAPFNAILVTAGAAEPPPQLLEQLAPGGRMVMPIGPTTAQERLTVYRKGQDGLISRCILGSAMFVPLTGQGARPNNSMGLQGRGLDYCYGADLGRWDFEPVHASMGRDVR